MQKNFEEKSDYIIYVERTPDQRLANLANVSIEDKTTKNLIFNTYSDVLYDPHNECKLKPPYIRFTGNLDDCNGCTIACSNAKEIKPRVIKDRTDEYINKYIVSEFNRNDITEESYHELSCGFLSIFTDESVNKDLVAKKILSLSYEDFLKTYYWNIITRYLKKQANEKCRVCDGGGILHVHHRTYDTHGYEADNLIDLIVLCEDCHAKFHDKI